MTLEGRDLKRVFSWQDPFRTREDTAGDNGSDARTILAANANYPLELEVRAFCRAAADWPGSPLIIQFSHNALRFVGGQDPVPAAAGGSLARAVVQHFICESGATHVAVSLDHFRVPSFPGESREGSARAVRLARASVDDAVEASRNVLGEIPEKELESYVVYLSSPAYADFRRELAAVLTSLEPAWAMIDTEKLPPILDFALTRDIVEFIRRGLGYSEMMIEAEYGATGSAGEARDYVPLRGDELAAFAEEVAAFVVYTGADGISYPIGMEHAAPSGERHEPDEGRLRVVQGRILQVAGRYVPFAQHGGTGAARLVRGFVGKNNVNTHFLVRAANRVADRVQSCLDDIRAGEKKACGVGLYDEAARAVYEAAVEKMKEAGSFGAVPDIEQAFPPVDPED